MGTADKVYENYLRRKAKRLGLMLRKSRARMVKVDDRGGYMVVNPQGNWAIAGQRFDLNLDDVAEVLNDKECSIKRGRGYGKQTQKSGILPVS
jgi:hypothetical protein